MKIYYNKLKLMFTSEANRKKEKKNYFECTKSAQLTGVFFFSAFFVRSPLALASRSQNALKLLKDSCSARYQIKLKAFQCFPVALVLFSMLYKLAVDYFCVRV